MKRFAFALTACLLPAWFALNHCQASEGNQLLGIGPIQESLAGAGVATAKDATWSLLNPAALVTLEHRLDAYLMLLFLDRRIEPDGWGVASNQFAGEMSDTRSKVFPSFAVAWPHESGVFGFGVMGVEGNAVDFDHSRSTLGRLHNADRRSELEVAVLPFAYAHQFDNGWAVGGALLVEAGRLRSDSLTIRLRPTKGDYEWDYAMGAGWQVGVYRAWEAWSVGASYRSLQNLQAFDDYDDLTQFSIDMPPQFQVGVAYRPSAILEWLADYKYIGWTETKQFGEKTIPKGGLDWDDQHIGKLALSWRLSERLTLRVGSSYGKSPLDKKVVFVNGHFPGVVELHAGIGLSCALNEHSHVHVSFGRAFEKSMKDNGRGSIFSLVGRGTRLSMEQNFVSVGYTRRF